MALSPLETVYIWKLCIFVLPCRFEEICP